MFLRFLLESYLELSLCTLINLQSLSKDNLMSIISVSFTLIMGILLLAYPIFMISFLMIHQ